MKNRIDSTTANATGADRGIRLALAERGLSIAGAVA